MADLGTPLGPERASPAFAAPPLAGVAAALFAVGAVLAAVGAATAQPLLTGAALLLASTVSILALLAAGFAVADLRRSLGMHAAAAAVRSVAALLMALALVAAPAWTLLLA